MARRDRQSAGKNLRDVFGTQEQEQVLEDTNVVDNMATEATETARTESAETKQPQDYFNSEQSPRRDKTYFAEGTVIEGILRSNNDVEIVGDFKGEIMSEGKVTICANTVSSIAARDLELVGSTLVGDATVTGNVLIDDRSRIAGNIRAKNVDSAGEINGNLFVEQNVALRQHAAMVGDIKTGTLSMDRGAKFNGKLEMGQ